MPSPFLSEDGEQDFFFIDCPEDEIEVVIDLMDIENPEGEPLPCELNVCLGGQYFGSLNGNVFDGEPVDCAEKEEKEEDSWLPEGGVWPQTPVREVLTASATIDILDGSPVRIETQSAWSRLSANGSWSKTKTYELEPNGECSDLPDAWTIEESIGGTGGGEGFNDPVEREESLYVGLYFTQPGQGVISSGAGYHRRICHAYEIDIEIS
jgi:hypothetical protein